MIFLIKFLLLLTVFLTPLLGSVKGFGYEQVKVFFFVGSLTVCGILWTIYSLKHPVKIRWSSINKSAALFICVLFLTSVFGIDPFNSFIGSQPYFQGWILYSYLYLFFLLVTWAKIKLEKWSYILVGSSTLVGILSIKDWVLLNILHEPIPNYAGRVVSTFGQPNFYSGFILLTLPFFLYLLASKGVPFRGWIMAGFVTSVLAIVLSQSRSSYLILSGLLIGFLIMELKIKRMIILTGLGVLFFTIFLISTLTLSGLFGKEVIEPILTRNPDLTKASVENRVYIWPITWQLFLQKPFTGYGLENIAPTFSKYFIENKHTLFEENLKIQPVLISLKDLNLDRTHNYLLDLFLFSGLLGLVSWIVLVILLIRKLGQTYHGRTKFVLITSLITYLIWIQFQNQSIVHLVYFWFLVGVIDKGE